MTPSKTKFGKFLRTRRIKLGLRQVQIAELLGLPSSSCSQLEVGARRYLAQKQLEDLSRVLRCDILQLQALVPKRRWTEPKTEFGRFIRSRREQLGLTRKDFAERLKMPRQQAAGLEIGTQQGVRYHLLKPLAKALDLELSALSHFIGEGEKSTSSMLGQMIRAGRKRQGLSQNELANKLGVTRQYVSYIESGQIPISIGSVKGDLIIEQLARILKLDLVELQAVRPKRKLKQKKIDSTTLGGFLTARRLKLGITQKEAAKRAEISQGEVCGIEVGRIRPSRKLLDRLAKALECETPAEFLSEGRR